MILVLILSVFVGMAMVVQSGLSTVIAEKDGLGLAIHLSNFVVLVVGLAVLSAIPLFWKTDFSELLKMKFEPKNWSWWYIVPGLCGIFTVTMMPWAVYKVGAAKIFVAVIAAQVIASLLWDYFVEGTPLDVWRIAGGALTCAGAVTLNFTKTS